MEEFQMAHARLMEGRRKLLIPIMMEDITQEDLDPTLELYIKTHHYIKYTKDLNLLRKKLVFAMPRKPLRELLAAQSATPEVGLQNGCQSQVEPASTNARPTTYGTNGASHRSMVHGLASDKVIDRLSKKRGLLGDVMRERMEKRYNKRLVRFREGYAKNREDKETTYSAEDTTSNDSESDSDTETTVTGHRSNEQTPLLSSVNV